jgi:hypothetical protein
MSQDQLLTNQKSKLQLEICHLQDEVRYLSRFYGRLQKTSSSSVTEFTAIFREGKKRQLRDQEQAAQIALWEDELAAREATMATYGNDECVVSAELLSLQSEVRRGQSEAIQLAAAAHKTNKMIQKTTDEISRLRSAEFVESMRQQERTIAKKSNEVRAATQQNADLTTEKDQVKAEIDVATREIPRLQAKLIQILHNNGERQKYLSNLQLEQNAKHEELQAQLDALLTLAVSSPREVVSIPDGTAELKVSVVTQLASIPDSSTALKVSTPRELESVPNQAELEVSTPREHASIADPTGELDFSRPNELAFIPETTLALAVSTPRDVVSASRPINPLQILAMSAPEEVISIPSSTSSRATSVVDQFVSGPRVAASVVRVHFVDSEVLESVPDFSVGDECGVSDLTSFTSLEALSDTESTSVVDDLSEVDRSFEGEDSSASLHSSPVGSELFNIHVSERSELSIGLSSVSGQYQSDEELDSATALAQRKPGQHTLLSESDGDTSETDIDEGDLL